MFVPWQAAACLQFPKLCEISRGCYPVQREKDSLMMKLAIIGVTGFVGARLASRALAAGHSVRALVRSPQKLGELASKIEVVRGDLLMPAAVDALVQGAEAVISVAGPPRRGRHDSLQHAQGTRTLVEAMPRAQVQRLISIAGAAAKVPGQRLGLKQLLLRALLSTLVMPDVIRTKDLELEIIAASGLNYTVLRPPLIGTGHPTGRVAASSSDMTGTRVDVDDLVEFILSLLSSSQWDRKAPIISSR